MVGWADSATMTVDVGALSEFCREMQPRLVGALSLYTGEADLAEELTQETLVRVCQRWPSVRAMDRPDHWATRVAFNLAKSRFRRRAAKRRAMDRLRGQPRFEHRDVDTPTAIAVRQAVAALPDRPRTALVLRYYADLGVEDVAGLMGCPTGTVKTLTAQAITMLRRAGLEVDDG
jgi:RNA polymerase sigma factor (sigma-70 family)